MLRVEEGNGESIPNDGESLVISRVLHRRPTPVQYLLKVTWVPAQTLKTGRRKTGGVGLSQTVGFG